MSLAHRRTEIVFAVIQELVSRGHTALRPGDVNSELRKRGEPLGTWEVRAEFNELAKQNRLACDEDTGQWHLTENANLKSAG